MIQVAFKGRWRHRDSTLILMGFLCGRKAGLMILSMCESQMI